MAALPAVVFGASFALHILEHQAWVERRATSAEQHFKEEMVGTLDHIQAALSTAIIQEDIIANDASSSADTIRELARIYDFSALAAVNADGIVLARLASPRKGDFLFQTSSWGRAAAQGQETVQLGPGRGGYPLVMIAAVPLMQEGIVRGALIGGHILNDAYAVRFKQSYLRSEEHVVFYSKEDGIAGLSFQDPEVGRLFRGYFNQGSDAIQQSESSLIIGHFEINGELFHVSSIKLYDPSGYVAGMLVLVPVRTWIPYAVSGILALLTLLFLCMRVLRKRCHGRELLGFSATIFLIAGGTVLYGQWVGGRLYPVLMPQETIYNSTMELLPDADILSLHEQRIAIQINTGSEAINAAHAGITYDPAAVRIVDIDTRNSFCSEQFFLERHIDNERGKAVVACVAPFGLLSDKAILADLVVQPLRVGNFTLEFDTNTSVLAHDGLGTDVLRMATGGAYQVISSTVEGSDGALPLFSYSHPNSTRWYSQRSIHIDWPRLGYGQFAYAFDQVPDTIPDGSRRTSGINIDLMAEKNGVYYFHLLPLGGATRAVSHLKIMIDSIPPETPEIRSSATSIRAGETVRFTFADRGDDLSGMQKNFYARFDGTFFPVLSELNVPFLTSGVHSIYLRVFDNAGNFRDTQVDITVQ